MTVSDPVAAAKSDEGDLLRARCVLLGEPGVGKTTLVRRLLQVSQSEPFDLDLEQSTAAPTVEPRDQLEPRLHGWMSPDRSVELQLVDCSGRQPYRAWLRRLAQPVDWLLVGVFDLTSGASLTALREQLQSLQPNRGGGVSALGTSAGGGGTAASRLGVLVGTKADLTDRRQVSAEEAGQLARQLEFGYFECSCVDGGQPRQPFCFLAEKLASRK